MCMYLCCIGVRTLPVLIVCRTWYNFYVNSIYMYHSMINLHLNVYCVNSKLSNFIVQESTGKNDIVITNTKPIWSI